MPERDLRNVFKKGSRTFFNSSRFFPKAVREDVSILYGFLRTADDLVDAVPQRADEFRSFDTRFREARAGGPTGDPIIDRFAALEKRRGFDPSWTDAFLHAMALDLVKRRYARIEETLEYVHGSAEVVGLMTASLMGLPPEAFPPAAMLGRAMQYINFLRDIAEDNGFGRTYLPAAEMSRFGLSGLGPEAAARAPEAFRSFVRAELDRYRGWQAEAERGFRYLPRRLLVPVRTASKMYKWTAARISSDPFIVFRTKVKPSRWRILGAGLVGTFARKG
jgi:phytoene synthase